MFFEYCWINDLEKSWKPWLSHVIFIKKSYNYGWYGNGCLVVLAVKSRDSSVPHRSLHNPSTHILEHLWGPKNWWSGFAPGNGNPMAIPCLVVYVDLFCTILHNLGGKKVGSCGSCSLFPSFWSWAYPGQLANLWNEARNLPGNGWNCGDICGGFLK
jgi:hypothetical protein